MFKRKITKNGNSRTISIPAGMLMLLKLKIGDTVDVCFDNNKIIIQKESKDELFNSRQ